MSPAATRPSRESVLDAFAVESEPGRSTLERYLRLYPEYAGELVDLSRELSREVSNDTAPLSATDQGLINDAWTRHAAAMPAATVDPFAALTVDDWRTVAQRLDVPRQIVTALRERRVSRASIPRGFFGKLAEGGASTKQMQAVSGHKTLKKIERYTAAAAQPELAKAGLGSVKKPRKNDG